MGRLRFCESRVDRARSSASGSMMASLVRTSAVTDRRSNWTGRLDSPHRALSLDLPSERESWYSQLMRNSYIGIIDRTGVRILVPEHEHTARFLSRRSRSEDCVCFWAVVDDALANAIHAEINAGNRADALHLLHCLAVDLGTILPSDFAEIFSARTA